MPRYGQIAANLTVEVDRFIQQVQDGQDPSFSRARFAERAGLPYSTLTNVLNGWRRPSMQHLTQILLALAGDPTLVSRWRDYTDAFGLDGEDAGDAAPRRKTPEPLSRTHRIRLGQDALRVGILDYSLWARKTPTSVEGLIPDLLTLLASSMGIECRWSVLSFERLIDAVALGDVDLAAGFICRTPKRTTRTVFVPLGLPAVLSIQAITRAVLPRQRGFSERKSWLADRARSRELTLVIVEGELAWDCRHSLFAPDVPVLAEGGGDIHAVAKKYWKREDVVLLTDHVTAGELVARSGEGLRPFREVLTPPAGVFPGGFLLPASDREFLKFFRHSWEHLLVSRMPVISETLAKYAVPMTPFLNGSLSAWLSQHWAAGVPVPPEWKRILKSERSSYHVPHS